MITEDVQHGRGDNMPHFFSPNIASLAVIKLRQGESRPLATPALQPLLEI